MMNGGVVMGRHVQRTLVPSGCRRAAERFHRINAPQEPSQPVAVLPSMDYSPRVLSVLAALTSS